MNPVKGFVKVGRFYQVKIGKRNGIVHQIGREGGYNINKEV